ncbi:hypothetical protein JCM11641_005018 [Rhodosporidiobolus odoratus]
MSTVPSPSNPGDPSALLSSAISFLRDPSTSTSPLAQRIQFLESKGLNQQEIQQALAQAQAPSFSPVLPSRPAGGAYPAQPGHGGYAGYGQAREYEKDWRDWFVMGVVGGGVGWLAVKLAQKFLLPSLQPPSESDLEASQRALEAKYDEASALLRTLQESTDAVAASLDEQKESVEKELDEVKKAVAEMREGERRRDEWAKKVEAQVEDMARSLPGLLDKQHSTSSASLNELQTELKSLKSLLLARRLTPGSPSFSGSASPAASPSASSLPFNIKPPGLPAWQMKGNSAAPTTTAATSTGGSVGYAAPDASKEDGKTGEGAEKDTSASGVLVERPEERKDDSEGQKEEQN